MKIWGKKKRERSDIGCYYLLVLLRFLKKMKRNAFLNQETATVNTWINNKFFSKIHWTHFVMCLSPLRPQTAVLMTVSSSISTLHLRLQPEGGAVACRMPPSLLSSSGDPSRRFSPVRHPATKTESEDSTAGLETQEAGTHHRLHHLLHHLRQYKKKKRKKIRFIKQATRWFFVSARSLETGSSELEISAQSRVSLSVRRSKFFFSDHQNHWS